MNLIFQERTSLDDLAFEIETNESKENRHMVNEKIFKTHAFWVLRKKIQGW
jgi:hypothetical protein